MRSQVFEHGIVRVGYYAHTWTEHQSIRGPISIPSKDIRAVPFDKTKMDRREPKLRKAYIRTKRHSLHRQTAEKLS